MRGWVDSAELSQPADLQDKPEDGVNALDAAVSAYTSIAMLRQHLPADHKITIVIKGSERFISNSEFKPSTKSNLLITQRYLIEHPFGLVFGPQAGSRP
jgi:hypothetical protein